MLHLDCCGINLRFTIDLVNIVWQMSSWYLRLAPILIMTSRNVSWLWAVKFVLSVVCISVQTRLFYICSSRLCCIYRFKIRTIKTRSWLILKYSALWLFVCQYYIMQVMVKRECIHCTVAKLCIRIRKFQIYSNFFFNWW